MLKSKGTLKKFLTAEQEQFIEEEKTTLSQLKETLVTLGASKEDIELLSNTIEQIEEVFLVVVVGEFNSGKSAFLNALLGKKLLKEGGT